MRKAKTIILMGAFGPNNETSLKNCECERHTDGVWIRLSDGRTELFYPWHRVHVIVYE